MQAIGPGFSRSFPVAQKPCAQAAEPSFSGYRPDLDEASRVDHDKELRDGLKRLMQLHVFPHRRRKVQSISDGDTIRVGDGLTIRFFGVDAQEKEQPHGIMATEFLKEMLTGRRVRLHTMDIDRHGRQIAVVERKKRRFLPGGYEDVGALMIEAGWAFASQQRSLFTKKQLELIAKNYAPLEDQARSEKRGMFKQGPKPEYPWTFRSRQKK